ncbi:MAG: AAA family ATPase, partial [Burkholderiales bacterium]|nr:AAA family ATPase [Burkholderiales bacterium]
MPHSHVTPASDAGPAEPGREWLSRTERAWVWRQPLPDGRTLIGKQPLGPDAQRRIRHERATLERLAGVEGVVQLAAVDQPEHLLWLQDDVGITLPQWLATARFDLDHLLRFALALAHTLAAVHRAGLVHKDIHPGNILLAGPQLRPVLIDFNLASLCAEEQPGFTHPNEIAGTLAYMAPEQTGRSGRPLDQRADLYALGATLYELATGQRPFDSEDMLALIHAHLARVPVPPSALAPALPVALSDIVMRLLEKDADRRYQSAEGLAADLARVADQLAQGQPQPFVLGERDFPLRLAPPSRLVGRDAEIDTLHRAFQDALQSPRGQVLLVSGPAGVGKTVLINELRPLVTARRGWFVTGKFDAYRPDASMGAAAQSLRALGAQLLAEPEESLAVLRQRLYAALGVNAGLMAEMLPEFGLLLPDARGSRAADPVRAAQRYRQGLLALMRSVASPERPLVMVLDDLQWASQRTISFIQAVLEDGALPGVLVVGTFREPPPAQGGLPAAAAAQEQPPTAGVHALEAALAQWSALPRPPQRLVLANLPQEALATLLQQMLRMSPWQATMLAQDVGERTHGNPYDSVELINALRRDEVLRLAADGWQWDPTALRRYVGRGDVVDLLAHRIERLPAATGTVLEALALLGNELRADLLATALQWPAERLESALSPALEDGLLVLERRSAPEPMAIVRFRHDRVHQAAIGRLDLATRQGLNLGIARRLAAEPRFAATAAEQYLAAVHLLDDAAECRRVAGLFQAAAQRALITHHGVAELYLAQAIALLQRLDDPADAPLLLALQTQRIHALAGLGRHEALDAAYEALVQQGHDALALAGPTCMRVDSLNNRGRQAEALAAGLAHLRRLGLNPPDEPAAGAPPSDDSADWARFYQRAQALDVATDLQRAPIAEPRLLAIAELLERLQVPAYYLGAKVAAWLLFEGQRLWTEHGPCPRLMHVIGGAVGPLVTMRQDYRLSYHLLRHALAIGQAHGWEPETSDTRYYHAILAMPWFEALERSATEAAQAREALLQWGLLPQAAYTYSATLITELDCAPTLEATASMADNAIAFGQRVGNTQAVATLLPYRQLARALRGETEAPGRLQDSGFDEAAHLAGPARGPIPAACYHVHAALACAIFDTGLPALAHHTGCAMATGARHANYRAALAHALRGLALARQLPADDAPQRAARLAELDACQHWLAQRAADAPMNFAHLATWIAAERAWGLGEVAAADAQFTAALRQVQGMARPWHRALITERAGLFLLARGPAALGRHLLEQACTLYAEWGASAKAREMLRAHTFLQPPARRKGVFQGSVVPSDALVSPDALDMVAILRASQALSSETSLARLKSRVAELLGALTGASSVLLVVRGESASAAGAAAREDWFVSEAGDDAGAAIPVDEAAARGLLPVSAFRYALRTRAPLVVDDAVQDDRFARDPYFSARPGPGCALLVLPILNQNEPRAVLLLENRLSRGAFSGDRLDAVTLIAGQLAVSLDNALLYASLERKVAQRTADLQELVNGLESFNRSISHDLRGPLGGIAGLATLAAEALERNDDTVARRVLPTIARQAEASTRLVATLLALARVGDAQLRR